MNGNVRLFMATFREFLPPEVKAGMVGTRSFVTGEDAQRDAEMKIEKPITVEGIEDLTALRPYFYMLA